MQSPSNSLLRFLLPSLQDIFFIAIFFSVIGFGPRLINVDGDLGRHLTIGEYILQNLTIPTRDLFSHTLAGALLAPHEWLAQLIFALFHRLWALDGVVWFSALLIALTFSLVYQRCTERSKMRLLPLGFALLAAAAASLHWLTRPHLWTMLLLVFWITALEKTLKGELSWWLLPLLMLVWANLHGAFLAGFAVWATYLLAALWDRWRGKEELAQHLRLLGKIGLASFAASFINPVTWRLWVTVLSFLQNRYLVGHTAEYLPPNFSDPSTWPFLVLIALTLLLFVAFRASLTTADALLIVTWTIFALLSTRNIPLYAILVSPILAAAFTEQLRKLPALTRFLKLETRLGLVEAKQKAVLWPLIFVLGIGAALFNGSTLDFARQGNRFLPQVFPVDAVNWLEDHPLEGKVFNHFTWGGYLLYRLWPEQRVFIDGQTDFYGEALTRQYAQVITLSDGWEAVLADYEVSWALLPSNSPLSLALETHPGWLAPYQDQTATVWLRSP